MDEPRLSPAPRPYAPEIEETLGRLMGPGVEPLVLFRTLAHNPRVLSRVLAGGFLDKGSVTLRERELAILRTTARCGSEYEWGVHVSFFSGRAGLSPEEVRATCARDVAPGFGPRERLILELCDSLHDRAAVDDALWQRLAAEFQAAQIVELIALAGFYHLISFATNALRIALEPGAARFPA